MVIAPFLLLALGAGPPTALRIATFNAEWLVASADENSMDPWRDEASLERHRRGVARVLAGTRADLLCLIESTSRAALEKLLEEPALRLLGYKIYHLESDDHGTGQDVAFLARIPLDSVDGRMISDFREAGEESELRPGRKGRGRSFLSKRAVVFLTAGRLKLGVLGLHLLAHPDDARRTRKREAQARLAAGIIREHIVARGYTPVVLGDFNDFDPDVGTAAGFPDRRRRVLPALKNFDPSRPGDELLNATGRLDPPTERYSAYWDKNKNDIWDGGEPVSLMDHILLDRGLEPRFRRVEIPHDPKDGSISDHWPVVVELVR